MDTPLLKTTTLPTTYTTSKTPIVRNYIITTPLPQKQIVYVNDGGMSTYWCCRIIIAIIVLIVFIIGIIVAIKSNSNSN